MSRHIESHQTLMLLSHIKLLHACYGIEFHPTQFLQFVLPLAAAEGNTLCPVTALRTMIIRFPADLSCPAFLIPDNDGALRPLLYPVLTQFLTDCLFKLGYNPKFFAMHSFRRGGCTHGHSVGLDSDSLKLHGRWRSNAYQAYLEPDLRTRLQVSKTMISGI